MVDRKSFLPGDDADPEAIEPQVDDGTADDQPLAAPAHMMAPAREHMLKLQRWADPLQTINIADELDDTFLGTVGDTCRREFEIDDRSRDKWLEGAKAAMALAMQISENVDGPWRDSSAVIYPLISQAAINFHARAYPAIVASPDVVKGIVVGPDVGVPALDPNTGQPIIDPQTGKPAWAIKPGTKRLRADRVAEHMSWQLLDESPDWEEDTDKLLIVLPIVGCVFRKVFYDGVEQRNTLTMVPAEDLVINYRAKSMERAPRLTEIMPLYPIEIEEQERAKVFLTYNYGPAEGGEADDDAPREFHEQHRRLDLDGDGYAEPYVVTYHKLTSKVVRITARYDADGVKFLGGKVGKIDPIDYYQKYDFLPNPDGGIYGMGFGQLLRPINESVNSSLNMMFDAETLKIHGGGFIGKGLSMHTGRITLELGEWKPVNASGQSIKDSIVPLEHRGASEIMFQLLGFMSNMGKELAANVDVLTGQTLQANMPATTTLALIEQGLKVFNGLFKRVHRAAKGEYAKVFRLNRIHLNDQASYRRGDSWKTVTRQDYALSSGVVPISDPNMVSDMQKLMKAEFLKGFLNDGWMNPAEIRRRIFTSANIDRIDELLRDTPLPNPAFILKSAKMANDLIDIKARGIFHIARAVQALATAEKFASDSNFQMAQTQMTYMGAELAQLQESLKALNADNTGESAQLPGPQAYGNPGAQPAGVPGVAQPPGH